MPRKPSLQPTKNKVIQIRVTEEIYNNFNELCSKKWKDTPSSVGNMLIQMCLKKWSE